MPSAHCAVLLAGGASTRMGTDKARLLVAGVPLWQRQLATLRGTEPARLAISVRTPCAFSSPGIAMLVDESPGSGPLGGIAAALAAAVEPWVLVLAVDMPEMNAGFLNKLIQRAGDTRSGVVPMTARGLEPLAAVYPAVALSIARSQLASGRRKLESFVIALERAGLVQRYAVAANEEAFFTNWNTPDDLQPIAP